MFNDDFLKMVGSIIISGLAVIKSYFFYRNHSNEKQAKLELSIDNLKTSNVMKTIARLDETVSRIEPLVKAHDETVNILHQSVKGVDQTEKVLIEMMSALKVQYENFQNRMDKVTAGGHLISSRIDKIESEVVAMKSGNIWVRSKKQ